MNFVVLIVCFYILLVSVIGYGFLLKKILFNKLWKDEKNFAYFGFFGLIFLTFLSYLSSLIFSHNIIHNLILHTIGIVLFFFLYKSEQKKYLKYIFYISLILLPGLFLSKTHDDFPYYHLPYVTYLAENKLIFGLGHLNHGYNLLSSLLNFNSIMVLPYLKFYSFNFVYLYFLIFFNFFILFEIFLKKNNKVIIYLYLSACVFFNLSFNRIGEFGTDKPGQLLIVLIVIKLFDLFFFSKKKLLDQEFLILIPIFAYVITLKAYFISYILFIFLFFTINKKFILFLKNFFFRKSFLFSFFLIFLMLIHYFVATGCLISPIKNLCFGNYFSWGRSDSEILALSQWLEQWAKAGAGPGFRVENPLNYINSLNWVSNWFSKYFMVKILDQIGILLISYLFVIFSIFNVNKFDKWNFNKNFFIFFTILILIFLVWFLKHPSLRYGGYAVNFLLISLTLSLIISNLEIKKNFYFNAKILIIFTLLIFTAKNLFRINHELKRNDMYVYDEFPFFKIKKPLFDSITTSSGLNLYTARVVNDQWNYCWNIPSPCATSVENISVTVNLGYYFISKKISN